MRHTFDVLNENAPQATLPVLPCFDSSPNLWQVQLGRIVLEAWQDVRVDIQGDVDLGVTQSLLNNLGMGTLLNHETGGSVSRAVEPDVRHSGLGINPLECCKQVPGFLFGCRLVSPSRFRQLSTGQNVAAPHRGRPDRSLAHRRKWSYLGPRGRQSLLAASHRQSGAPMGAHPGSTEIPVASA